MAIPRDIEQAFDSYLKAKQLAELKQYVLDNPSAKGYLSEKLYEVMNRLYVGKETLIQCEMLLEAGADPNYINNKNKNDTNSILQSSIRMDSPTFIESLLRYGAKPDLYVTFNDWRAANTDNASPEIQLSSMIWRKKLPLQLAVRKYINTEYKANANIKKICEILAKATITKEIEQHIIKILENQYKVLEEAVKNAIQNARKSNKQLIIMVGETHNGISSLIIEAMLILIAKQNGIETVLTEDTKWIKKSIEDDDYYPCCGGKWLISLPIHKLIKFLNMQSIPVDLGHFGAKKIGEKYDDYEELKKIKSDFDPQSNEGVKYRNEVMRDVIIGGIKQDSLLFVGCGHLYGLLEETPLPDDTITVMAVNACYSEMKIELILHKHGKLEEKDKQFVLESNKIIQANEEGLDLISSLLNPEIAIDYIRKVHKEFLIKNNLPEVGRLSLFQNNTCDDEKNNPIQSPRLNF